MKLVLSPATRSVLPTATDILTVGVISITFTAN